VPKRDSRQANKQGGVYGRKIDFVGYLDDAGSSTQDVQDAHQLGRAGPGLRSGTSDIDGVQRGELLRTEPSALSSAGRLARTGAATAGAFGYNGCEQPAPGTTTGDSRAPCIGNSMVVP